MSDTIFNQAGQTVGTQYNIGGTQLNGLEEEKLNLYRFSVSVSVQALFIASQEQLNEIIGKETYFKNDSTPPDGVIHAYYFTLITDDAHTIATLEESVGSREICGVSPLNWTLR